MKKLKAIMNKLGNFLGAISIFTLACLMLVFPDAITSIEQIGRNTPFTHLVVALWSIPAASLLLLVSAVYFYFASHD
ncbi:MAG: hypothetical protein GQ569_00005 [Methylococcaceae bacterium]|nr:hypothetical protein [Methylococcaceae bacterium]